MMKMKNIKAIFRRGQTQAQSKPDQQPQQQRGDLSRSSSISNLNSADLKDRNKGAFAKVRKSASKDRLDKLGERKVEKKGKVFILGYFLI